LVNKHSDQVASPRHLFVLVNLNQRNLHQQVRPPEFYVMPSRIIAEQMQTTAKKSGAYFLFYSGEGHRTLSRSMERFW
jgi:hypothetical protein